MVYVAGTWSIRRPILVATVSPASGRSRSSRATNCSLRPSPYTSAVSMKVTPASTAACNVAMASSSGTSPHADPICHAPSPTTLALRPVRPKSRCST